MNTLEIPAKKIFVTYPSSWEEMTRKQAIYAGDLLYMVANKMIDIDQFRKLMVDKFIKRVNNRAPSLTNDDELDLWGNDWLLLDTVNFFFKNATTGEKPVNRYKIGKVKLNTANDENIKQNDEKGEDLTDETTIRQEWEILPTFTKQLIGWIRVSKFGVITAMKAGKKLYGPGDFMQDMCFAEYKDALAAAMKYMETNDDLWLDRLTAILYREKRAGLKKLMNSPDFDGRIRVTYNPGMVEHGMRMTKHVRKGIKYMALMYIMGCLWNLRNNEDGIEIDGGKCDFSILFMRSETEETATEEGVGMIGVMMALAESGVFGNLKDVANADVWDVLVRMYQLEIDRRAFEKRMNTNKTN